METRKTVPGTGTALYVPAGGSQPAVRLHQQDGFRPGADARDPGLNRLVPIRSSDPGLVELFAGSTRPMPHATLVIGGARGNLMGQTSGRTGLAYLADSGLLQAGRNHLVPLDQNSVPRETYLTAFKSGAPGSEPLADATMARFDAMVEPTVGVNVTQEADVETRLKPIIGTDNALIHAALPPGIFSPMLTALHDSGICAGAPGPFRRVLLEKPFGTDYASAVKLGEQVKRDFAPGDVLLLDHFLAYPGMLNLTSFRKDPDIDAALTSEYVSKVDLKLLEIMKGNDRPYFRDTGSLKDMVQNHAMQLLGTLGMEMPPGTDSGPALQRARTAVVNAVHIDPASIRRGQYEGFNDLAGGAPEGAPPTNAETYVGFNFKVDTDRWQDVPFTLTQAKGVSEKRTGADVHLRKLPPGLASRLGVSPDTAAVFHITVQPDPKIVIELPSQHRSVDYAFDERINPMPPYARLISDALKGDTSLFVEPDSAIAAWKLVEGVQDEWNLQGVERMFKYTPGANADTL